MARVSKMQVWQRRDVDRYLPQKKSKQQTLTIQGSLADSHDQSGEKHQNRFGDTGPRDDLFVVAPE